MGRRFAGILNGYGPVSEQNDAAGKGLHVLQDICSACADSFRGSEAARGKDAGMSSLYSVSGKRMLNGLS